MKRHLETQGGSRGVRGRLGLWGPVLLLALGAAILVLWKVQLLTAITAPMLLLLLPIAGFCLACPQNLRGAILVAVTLEGLLFVGLALAIPSHRPLDLRGQIGTPKYLEVSSRPVQAAVSDQKACSLLQFRAPVGIIDGRAVLYAEGHVVFGKLQKYQGKYPALSSLCLLVPNRFVAPPGATLWEFSAQLKILSQPDSGEEEALEIPWPAAAIGWARDSLLGAAWGSEDVTAIRLLSLPAVVLPLESAWSWEVAWPAGIPGSWTIDAGSKIENPCEGAELHTSSLIEIENAYEGAELRTSSLLGLAEVGVAVCHLDSRLDSHLSVSANALLIAGFGGKLLLADGRTLDLPRPFWALVEASTWASIEFEEGSPPAIVLELPKCPRQPATFSFEEEVPRELRSRLQFSATLGGSGYARWGQNDVQLKASDELSFDVVGRLTIDYVGCEPGFRFAGVAGRANLNDSPLGAACIWETLPSPVRAGVPSVLAGVAATALGTLIAKPAARARRAFKESRRGADSHKRTRRAKDGGKRNSS